MVLILFISVCILQRDRRSARWTSRQTDIHTPYALRDSIGNSINEIVKTVPVRPVHPPSHPYDSRRKIEDIDRSWLIDRSYLLVKSFHIRLISVVVFLLSLIPILFVEIDRLTDGRTDRQTDRCLSPLL